MITDHLSRRAVAGLIYTAAFIAAVVTVSIAQPAPVTVDRVIMADNFTMIFCQACIAVMIGWILWTRCRWQVWHDPIDLALCGVVVEAVGWMLHRAYWAVWRLLRALEMNAVADSMTKAPAFLTAGSFVLICAGAILIVSPASRKWFGPHWPAWSVLTLAIFYWITYQAPDLILALGG